MAIVPVFDPTTGASGGSSGGGSTPTGQGEPKLVLDYSPRGTGGPYAGTYTGTDHTIEGVTWKIQNQTSGASTIGTVNLTATGLQLSHTGTTGEPMALRLDASALTGMTGALNGMCVQASFAVAAWAKSNTSVNLLVNQAMPANAGGAYTQYDMQAQAIRFNATNYGVRAQRRNASGSTTYSYSTTNLSSSGAPANVTLGLFGSAYTWWIGGDTTAGPAAFQAVGTGANQRKMIMPSGGAYYPGSNPDGAGIDHPVISLLIGSTATGTDEFTLTNLRIWTYGNP